MLVTFRDSLLTSFHDTKKQNIENCPEDVGNREGSGGKGGGRQNTELEINLRGQRRETAEEV